MRRLVPTSRYRQSCTQTGTAEAAGNHDAVVVGIVVVDGSGSDSTFAELTDFAAMKS
jgi:hypothetical protein